MAKKTESKLKITQTRSLIGQKPKLKKTIQALGLKRLNHSVEKTDSPQIRGMVYKVRHMVKVEEVS
jgi:large subunit ribosomal protein L30